jgi:hypothetical protein
VYILRLLPHVWQPQFTFLFLSSCSNLFWFVVIHFLHMRGTWVNLKYYTIWIKIDERKRKVNWGCHAWGSNLSMCIAHYLRVYVIQENNTLGFTNENPDYDFLMKAQLLTHKLIQHGFIAQSLMSSLQKFYGRYHELVYRHGTSVSKMKTALSFTSTHLIKFSMV